MSDTAAAISTHSLSIKNNVVRHLIMTLCGACLLAAALLAAFAPLPYADNEIMLRIGVGYIGIPVAVGIIYINLNHILHRREAILIDEQGITDRSNALASGFTPWDQISEVYLLQLKSDDFLCVEPLNFDAWHEGLTKAQKRLAEANKDAGFAPIRIQFKKVSDTVTSKDGLKCVKRIAPKKVTRTRKPRY